MKKVISILIGFFIISLSLLPFHAAAGQSDIDPVKHVVRITERLKSPMRIAIDSQDLVYVTDPIQGKILKYDPAGNFLSEFITGSSPLAIAVTARGRIFIADKLSGELQLLDSRGKLMKKIPYSTEYLELPSSAVVSEANNLYVVDSKKKIVRIFDANGDEIGSFGDDILKFPTGIAFDQKNQRIIIAEHGGLNINSDTNPDNLIHVFDEQGTWLTSFGEYGYEKGQFTRIQGITVDRSGRIYAVDPYQATITVLNERGDYLLTIGQFGTEPGQLRSPMDVKIDSKNQLWAASMNNGSLDVYQLADIPTDVNVNPALTIPSKNQLMQNYPNPFNQGTWIPFTLAEESPVIIHIYNEIGKLIKTFDLGKRPAGNYGTEGRAVFWDGRNSPGETVASGIYFYEIRTKDYVSSRRMIILK